MDERWWWIESNTMVLLPVQTDASAIRNRNTFVDFVSLIWNIFLFMLNTQVYIELHFARKIECACALQTQFQFNAAFFPILAGCCVSAKETLFASSFYSEEKLAVVFIFTTYLEWLVPSKAVVAVHSYTVHERPNSHSCLRHTSIQATEQTEHKQTHPM